jgi:hypothetical protein
MSSGRLIGVLFEGQVLLARSESLEIGRRMKSRSKGFPRVDAARAVKNLQAMRGLPRVGRELLHQRTWQGQSGPIRKGKHHGKFSSIPGHSIPTVVVRELPVKIPDWSRQ